MYVAAQPMKDRD